MVPVIILPLPVRPVVHRTALLAGGFDGGFADVPVVAEEEVGQHLVADLVGAGPFGQGGFLGVGQLVGILRQGLVDDGRFLGFCGEQVVEG